VFAGFVIFAYIGYIAKQSGQSIEDVIQEGVGFGLRDASVLTCNIGFDLLWI
jgi:hypothetical protein